MVITGVRFERVKGTWDYRGPLGEERLVRPVDIYPEFRSAGAEAAGIAPGGGPPYAIEGIFLYVDTDEGVSGMYGPVQGNLVPIIARQLAPIVVGEHPHAVARMWDKMYRNAIHGRKGETMMAISTLDIALWDLKGRLLDTPVYQLLGGPTREKVRAYASMLGHSIAPEMVAERARKVADEGYTATKWFFRYDPTEGPAGQRKNLELIRNVRAAVGDDVDIMFDAWSSWDVPYTIRMAELAADSRPWWFEEPVMPDMIPQYAEIRRSVSTVAISGGEHEYTRWGIKALLDAGAVDILQPDPTWAGGLTEMVRICALASAYAIPVIPHHGSVASLHLIASQPLTTCPIQEWLIQHGARGQALIKHKIEPVDGHIALPDRAGLGLEIDDAVVDSREALET